MSSNPHTDFMKPHLTIALAGAVALQTACNSGSLQMEYEEAAQSMARSTRQFQQAVAKSAKAKVRMMSSSGQEEKEFSIPKAEYALLREIMLHTKAVPPALETDPPGCPDFPCVVELIFADAHGVELTGIVINYERWMRQSDAQRLHPEPSRPWDTPDWCLPDADIDTLHALPSMQRAKALSRDQAYIASASGALGR